MHRNSTLLQLYKLQALMNTCLVHYGTSENMGKFFFFFFPHFEVFHCVSERVTCSFCHLRHSAYHHHGRHRKGDFTLESAPAIVFSELKFVTENPLFTWCIYCIFSIVPLSYITAHYNQSAVYGAHPFNVLCSHQRVEDHGN